MRVVLPDRTVTGRAVDLRGEVSPPTVLDALRGDRETGVLAHVGHIHAGMALATRAALAAAARSLGERPPQTAELARLRARRATLLDDEPGDDLCAARRALAAADADVDRLRERVARLQGRVRARRESGAPADTGTDDAEATLRAAAGELADRETERAAARQRLDRLRERRRARRDAREEAMRLGDRIANLERAADRTLAERVESAFERALDGLADEGCDPDAVTRALAVARVARLDAPVVVEVDRFGSARAAHEWLDAPVVYV